MKRGLVIAIAFGGALVRGDAVSPDRALEIVQRSVRNIDADWAAAPKYDFRERDVITKRGKQTENTYEVSMIDGSPYNKLIARGGRPLPAAQAQSEERKLKQEIERRAKEPPGARQKRVAEYRRERRQDNALFREMAQAFDYRMAGEETVNGRRCFVVDAAPRPGYVPKSRDTKVLKGMRGRMWIDERDYQWVRVRAEVFRPVTFGLFIAHVEPGTAFTLEQQPVKGNLWLPSHFKMSVNAQILVWSRRSSDDETYTGYHPAAQDAEAPK